tara:strand:- start:15253 stop:16212 length:960 start_codon:yes stop_codon:yes gene_type:complete
MKFALISQAFVVKSYKVNNGKAYTLDGQPYSYSHSIGNEFFMGFWNYPFLFDGYYLNISDLHLINEDLDIIMFANDNIKEVTISILRKKFPNAFIIASVKEMLSIGDNSKTNNAEFRKNLFNEADAVSTPMSLNNPISKEFQLLSSKKLHWIPQPVNIDYLQDNYYVDKTLSIFCYQHHQTHRNANTKEIATHLSNKFNIPIFEKYTDHRIHGNDQLKIHIESWSKCLFMVNMDPTTSYGQQSTLCPSTGTIMFGGNNDANSYLYPSTNTLDVKKLELEMEKIILDKDYRELIIQDAYSKLCKTYSYDAIRQTILNILK